MKLYYHYQLIKCELGENGIDYTATTHHFYGTLEEKTILEQKAEDLKKLGFTKLETRILNEKQINELKTILKKDFKNENI